MLRYPHCRPVSGVLRSIHTPTPIRRILSTSNTLNPTPQFSTSTASSASHRLVKQLPYEACQIYSVIIDVNAYPEFVPYCTATKLLERRPIVGEKIEANQDLKNTKIESIPHELEVITKVGYKGFETDYLSRVICKPCESVEVIARPSSTFTKLSTTWSLSPTHNDNNQEHLEKTSTEVSLDLSFKFKNPLHEFLLSDDFLWKKFSSVMIEAFETRLAKIYKKPS